MKLLNVISDKHKRTVWLRAFHIWQHRPHEVAPLSAETRVCASCSTEFRGNFCPRCGQSAAIGRFSFKKAALLFIDVWGLGNRGMFRSIRDLALRPGYMIRDYLSGMQSAYFPPFKMFFLLTALSVVVEHGLGLNIDEVEKQKVEQNVNKNVIPDEEVQDVVSGMEEQGFSDYQTAEHVKSVMDVVDRFVRVMDYISEKNPAIFGLLTLVLFSLPLYFFIRSAPEIPDLRFSEFIVALVYTSNTYSIYSIAGKLLNSGLLKLLAVLMVFVTFHQLTGFRKRRMLRYVLLTILISSVTLIALTSIGGYITYLITKE